MSYDMDKPILVTTKDDGTVLLVYKCTDIKNQYVVVLKTNPLTWTTPMTRSALEHCLVEHHKLSPDILNRIQFIK